MSKLTLDTAIKHCLEVAEQNDTQADKWQEEGGEQWGKTTACRECAADHRQLADWLTELKELREKNKVLMQECDRLIKEKGELLSKVSGGDVLRVCQLEEQLKGWKEEYANLNKISYDFYEELKEAKRLLKAAVDDMKTLVRCDSVQDCLVCKYQLGDCDGFAFEWKHMEDVNNLTNPIE